VTLALSLARAARCVPGPPTMAISSLLTIECLPGLFLNPQRRRDASLQPPLLMGVGRTCRDASGCPRPSQGHARVWLDASGVRAPPAPTLRAGIDCLGLPSLMLQIYVLSISDVSEVHCNLFHVDVAKVDRECCTCCKCFRGILQAFVQNVSSISDVYCKRFDRMFICFTHMLQQYVRNVSFVSVLCCSKCF
jgi:hypothetical protein